MSIGKRTSAQFSGFGLLSVALSATLAGCGGNPDSSSELGPVPRAATSFDVAKATCGAGDRAETGLQGQIPNAENVVGFQGFNCNLQKTSATFSPLRTGGGGISMQFVLVHDKAGHTCGYAGPAFQEVQGTTVVDFTDPNNVVDTAVLTTPAMMNPGEGLRYHEGRGLLVSAVYNRQAPTTPSTDAPYGFDVYDVGTDCRHPQLLSTTTNIPFATTGLKPYPGATTAPPPTDRAAGHEGAISIDGLTYYISDSMHGVYHAMDISDPTHPRLISTFQNPSFRQGPNSTSTASGQAHGLSISNDGNRAYMVQLSMDPTQPGGMVPQDPTVPWPNGFMTIDTSEVQARRPGATMRLISEVRVRDASAIQMTIPVKIKGRPFVIMLGEAGAGQLNAVGRQSACNAGLMPMGAVQLFYMADEANPQLINKIRLEANNPQNCGSLPEVTSGSNGFLYDVHMCTVDNRDDATTLACSQFKSGVRIYDIRDPENIKEIAYFNPPALAGRAPGIFGCPALPFLDARTGMVYTHCGDAGAIALRFRTNAWPLPGSSTPPDRQL